MMSTTHATMGLLLAVPVALVAPELSLVVGAAALAGGVFPDLDLLVGAHRKTLHFPVLYWVPTGIAALASLLAPSQWTVAAFVFFLSAAAHSASDLLGAGVEARPWERTSDRAVFLHARDRWIRPRYLVRYDGAPEDLALAALLAVPGLLVFDGPVRSVTLGMLAVSAAYVVVRKRLPVVEERLL